MELAEVSLPRDAKGANDHWGWPVATKTADTIVLLQPTT